MGMPAAAVFWLWSTLFFPDESLGSAKPAQVVPLRVVQQSILSSSCCMTPTSPKPYESLVNFSLSQSVRPTIGESIRYFSAPPYISCLVRLSPIPTRISDHVRAGLYQQVETPYLSLRIRTIKSIFHRLTRNSASASPDGEGEDRLHATPHPEVVQLLNH